MALSCLRIFGEERKEQKKIVFPPLLSLLLFFQIFVFFIFLILILIFFSNIVGNFFLGYYNFFWCSITSHSVLNLNSNEMKDDALWGVASFLAANPSVRILTLQDQGEF